MAMILGLLQAWSTRHGIDPDAISYLDMGDAFMRGDWKMAINSYWSPLYSWLAGALMAVVNPSPYWEYATIHLLNFGIYVFALFAFRFFLGEYLSRQAAVRAHAAGAQIELAPAESTVLGFALFLWASLGLIQLRLLGPDMLVAAFALLAAGLLLRMQNRGGSWPAGLLFGIVLALGYLTKAFMFPMAFVFLGTSLVVMDSVRATARRVVPAVLAFAVIASVWLVPISNARGRWTFGSAATLNYAWSGGTSNHHWRGNANEGAPIHPTRLVPSQIPIFEFATPIGGTYPYWYDPSYWFEGLKAPVDVPGRSRIVFDNVLVYFSDFSLGGSLVVGWLILSLMRNSSPLDIPAIWEYRLLLVPAAAALTVFLTVWPVPRMLAPWFLLFYMGAYGTRLLPNTGDARKLMRAVVIVIALAALSSVGLVSARAAASIAREFADESTSPNRNWQTAQELRHMGLREGDLIAAMRVNATTGLTHSMWARLAKVRVVVEADARDTPPDLDDSQIIRDITSTGVALVVADAIPRWSDPAKWHAIGQTGYFARLLPRHTSP